jgi:CubicO group peptidase (beta-lactamase class C family)
MRTCTFLAAGLSVPWADRRTLPEYPVAISASGATWTAIETWGGCGMSAGKLERAVRQAQARGRVPALSVAVHRADRPLWTFQVGGSGTERELDADTLFRMGSITKTFTAVLVMQCRDEGLLDLDDPVSAHLPVPAHGALTIRRLLSHTSGIQREPYGDIWDTLIAPDVEQLIAELAQAEQVLPTGRRFHYSNLGLTVLGHLVSRLRGGTLAELLQDRILRPMGLPATTVTPDDRAAVGYLVDAYSDNVRPEPQIDLGGAGAAGQLWSTAADLAKWAAFLADPSTVDPGGTVLRASTVEEMRGPIVVTDEQIWAAGFGLGLILVPQGDRVVHVGHDGAMPGFLAAAYGCTGPDTPAAFGAAVLGSSGTGMETVMLPHSLLRTALDEDPPDVATWVPGEAAPEAYRSILGRWWSEGFEHVFSWRDGSLQSRMADAPAGRPPAVFAPIEGEPDQLRTVSGREAGERLRLTRDPATGDVVRMHWSTYRYTRRQETFDGISSHQP